jgi:hypothetical protein
MYRRSTPLIGVEARKAAIRFVFRYIVSLAVDSALKSEHGERFQVELAICCRSERS